MLKNHCALLMTLRPWTTWRTSASRTLVVLVIASSAAAAHGAGFSILHSFPDGDSDGSHPSASLILDSSGNLYGTTLKSGAGNLGNGTVFKLKTDGTGYATLSSPHDPEVGFFPYASLIVDSSGYLYGTAMGSGSSAKGAVFKLKADGAGFILLHSFSGGTSDGAHPMASLVLDSSGNLYGTTQEGGATNHGILFKVRTDGTGFTVLRSLEAQPYSWVSVTLDSFGYLYGTTKYGGQSGCGTVFRVKTDGTGYLVLYNFDHSNFPEPSLIVDSSGNLYGATSGDSSCKGGTIFKLKTDGTGFTVLHCFVGGTTGQGDPRAPLFLDSTGNLYGTTEKAWEIDKNGDSTGTVFRVKTDGTGFTILHSFIGGLSDGGGPISSVILDSAGNLYGTTAGGGPSRQGTVFKINIQEATEQLRGDALEQAGEHRDALASYRSVLRKSDEMGRDSDEDRRLREKIIGIVVKLDPPPVIPEEAERFMVRGRAAIEAAKTPVEFERAALEFQNALREAPWWADAYFNLGTVQEKAGQTKLAVENFKRYLLAAPNARDAREVKDQIYRLEYKEELAEKARQEAVQRRADEDRRQEAEDRRQEAERRQWEARRQNLAGVWTSPGVHRGKRYSYDVKVQGTTVEIPIGAYYDDGGDRNNTGISFRGTVDGRTITGTTSQDETWLKNGSVFKRPFTATISEDGNTIEIDYVSVGPLGSDKNGYARGWDEGRHKVILTRSQ